MKTIAALYTDEDMSALVATLLRSRGLDITTVPEQATIGKTDNEQLIFATSLSIAILFLVSIFACESEQTNNQNVQFYLTYGDSLSLIAMDTVRHELMAAIEKHGHVEAINYCKNYKLLFMRSSLSFIIFFNFSIFLMSESESDSDSDSESDSDNNFTISSSSESSVDVSLTEY